MRFLKFIKNPYLPETYERIALKDFLKLFGLLYVLAIWPNGITKLLIYNDIISSNSIDNLIYEYNPWYLFLWISIIVPFAEEIIFRLNLRTSKFNLIFSSTVVLIYTVILVYKNDGKYTSAWTLLIVYIITTALFYSKYFFNVDSKKYTKVVFYFSAITFGFLHIFNFGDPNYKTLILFPILTLPQIIMGSMSGYLRLNNGFIYGVLFHMMVNTVGLTLMLATA